MEELLPGKYRLSGSATAAIGAVYPIKGELVLAEESPEDELLRLQQFGFRRSQLRGAGVRGMLSDGPVSGGFWSHAKGVIKFQLLYNASLPYCYTINATKKAGSWQLEGTEGLLAPNHGTLVLDTFELVATSEELAAMARARDLAALPPEMSSTASAAPTTGDAVEKEEGSENGKTVATTATGASHKDASASSSLPASSPSACDVAHVASVPVPCAACGTSEVGSSRLAFFDMAVPHFGRAELVSFSCDDCGYKFNRVRTALGQPPGPKGKTLRLMVSPAPVPAAVNNDVDDNNDDQNNNARARDLNRLVVLSECAMVRVPVLELEFSAGTGRFTTVEGLVRSAAKDLSAAGLVGDLSNIDGSTTGAGSGGGGLAAVLQDQVDALLQSGESFLVEVEDSMALSWISGPTTAGRASSSPENRHTVADSEAATASAEADTAAANAANAAKGRSSNGVSGNSLISGLVLVEEWERSEEQNQELGCESNGVSTALGTAADSETEVDKVPLASPPLPSSNATTTTMTTTTMTTTTAMDAATLMQHAEAMAAEVTRQFDGQRAVSEDDTGNNIDGEGQRSLNEVAAAEASGENALGEVAGSRADFGDDGDSGMDDYEGMD